MRTVLNFAIALEKRYNEKFVVTRIVDIVKDLMGSIFLTTMSVQFFYRYNWVAEMILRRRSVFVVVESLHSDDAVSKSMEISYRMTLGCTRQLRRS